MKSPTSAIAGLFVANLAVTLKLISKMQQKTQATAGHFVKSYNFLLNNQPNRPKLNPLERELLCRLADWTKAGQGRYNYQSNAEWARLLGSSNKTVGNAFHRLRALRLVSWYSFPSGVGVKFLRFVKPSDLQRWQTAKVINEPTAADYAKAKQFTDRETLVKYVCKKPEALGHDVWFECCSYCNYQPENKAAEVVETNYPARVEVQLPWSEQQFQAAWAGWVEYRRKSGRKYVDTAQEQTALHKLHKETAGNLEWALQTIEAATAGGFLQLRPDLSKTVEPNIYAPEIPVNLLDWMNAEAKRRQQTPADEAEWKEWAKEFRQQYPNAPAWVTWSKSSRAWVEPTGEDWGLGNKLPQAIPEAHKELYKGFEIVRQQLDKTKDQYTGVSVEDLIEQSEAAANAFMAKKENEREKRAKQDAEIQAEFKRQLKARGYVQGDFSNENHKILEDVRREYPEHIDDVQRVEKLKQAEADEARRQKRYESLYSFGWDPAKPNSETNREAYTKSQAAHPEIW